MSSNKMHGEGNPEAAKQYNDQTRDFIEEGKVDKAADEAAPKTAAEKKEMEHAEKSTADRAVETEPKSSTK